MQHQPRFAFVTIRWFGMETWDHHELQSAGAHCHVFRHPSLFLFYSSSCPPASFPCSMERTNDTMNDIQRRRLKGKKDRWVCRKEKRTDLAKSTSASAQCAGPRNRWHEAERSGAHQDLFVDHSVRIGLVSACSNTTYRMCNDPCSSIAVCFCWDFFLKTWNHAVYLNTHPCSSAQLKLPQNIFISHQSHEPQEVHLQTLVRNFLKKI